MASESAASAGESYIGSFISLISKYEIRYEGILYHLNVQDSTIGLKDVRSFGTEGRKKDGAEVPPIDKVYEYILFRGSDIKDLQVKSPPAAQTEEQIHHDPAIIQSHSVGMPVTSTPLAPMRKNSLTESIQWQDTPALTAREHPGTLPKYQSAAQLGQPELSPVTQTSIYQQGYNATSISSLSDPHHQVTNQPPSAVLGPLTMHQLTQSPEIQASATLGSASEFRTPVSSSFPSTSVNPKFYPSPSPLQYSTFLDVPLPSSLPTLAPISSDPTFLTANSLNVPSFTSSGQDIIAHKTQMVNESASESEHVQPALSMPYFAASSLGSNLGPSQSPILPTPSQSILHGPHVLSSANQNETSAGVPMSSNLSSSVHSPVTQTPLLPLPTATQQTVPFTEEFDFTAMNEKFKKDEVWGFLGKGKLTNKADGPEENVGSRHLEETEGPGSVSNPKPAYKKDDFFDTISCNSLNHGRGAINGQSRFSERMRQDTETFGFQQRANLGYGGYGGDGPGGENFRGRRNWNRGYGYGYGGRGGRGGNMPF